MERYPHYTIVCVKMQGGFYMLAGFIAVAGMMLVMAELFRRRPEAQERDVDPDEIDYITLGAQIKKLHQTMERIDTLDRMITDIEICDPEVIQKAFACSWQSGGENREFKFWTTGADRQAEHLMQMALDEREQLRASLLDQIDRLNRERRKKNGRKTLFSQTDPAAGEGLTDGR